MPVKRNALHTSVILAVILTLVLLTLDQYDTVNAVHSDYMIIQYSVTNVAPQLPDFGAYLDLEDINTDEICHCQFEVNGNIYFFYLFPRQYNSPLINVGTISLSEIETSYFGPLPLEQDQMTITSPSFRFELIRLRKELDREITIKKAFNPPSKLIKCEIVKRAENIKAL